MGAVRTGQLSVVLAAVLGAVAAGCAARAAVLPELPPLDVPPAPPRVIAPLEVEAPPAPVPDTGLPSQSPPPERAGPARPAPAPSAADPRPDRDPAPPEESRPARTLETPVSGPATEQAIRDELARAAAWLRGVDYAGLSQNLKDQYTVAERFIQQAHEALGARNLTYAATLAGKAAEIAEILRRR